MSKKKPELPSLDENQIAELLSGLPQDKLMEVLAKASALSKGIQGEDAKSYVDTVKSQLLGLASQVEADERDHAARQAAAAEIERMLDTVMGAGVASAKALEPHREQIRAAFASADLSKIGEGLQLLASYLQNPTPDAKARTQSLLADLEKTFGPLVGYDPEREDRERREQIRTEVREHVAEIFAQMPKPDLSFKPRPETDDEPDKK